MRRYLRRVRPARGRVYQEVNYEPAEAMQVDWGHCGSLSIGRTKQKVAVFVAVLCWSRLRYIEFRLSQRKADFLSGGSSGAGVLRRQSAEDHLRQPEGGCHQRFGAICLPAPRVLGPLPSRLHGTDRLRGPRPGIEKGR